MQIACLESDMASFIKPFSSALEDVDIGEEAMFKGTLFIVLCLTNSSILGGQVSIAYRLQLERHARRGKCLRQYPNTDLIYVGALVTVSTCMWLGDERNANDAL